MASMNNHDYTVEHITKTIVEEIKKDPVLLACKSFVELHEHCDANTLGRQEALFDELGTKRAIPILNDAQHEVSLWLVANSIECQSHWDSIDMNVECHSAAFSVKHGRQADWNREESLCDELWFDEVYSKIRALVKERTGR